MVGVSPTVPGVSRTQALAFRARAQQLDRSAPDGTDATDLAVVDLGLADTPAGSAAQVLAARLPLGTEVDPYDGRRWTSVWGTRGAPYVHRNRDLRPMAAALWPVSADDAAARLAGTGTSFRKNGVDSLDVIVATVAAYEEVVTDEMPKGEASQALTERVPDEAISWCRPCQAHHLSDQLMRLAALPGGARLVPGQKATLAPIPRWPGRPEQTKGLDGLMLDYLRLIGPASAGDVASYLGTTQTAVKEAWPADRVEAVTVDGRKAFVVADALDDLLAAEMPTFARLLPRSDPWVLARDRDVTVPTKADQKKMWPMIGQPGAAVVDGEVVGAWRTKAKGRRVELTITTFGTVPPKRRDDLEAEAPAIAATRGLDDVTVTWA